MNSFDNLNSPQSHLPATRWSQVIAHVDMDAFFAAIEIRDNPSLRNHPVAVGGVGNRGVISTANYEARKYGVHSAMPSIQAKRLCPNLILLPGNHAHYRQVSAQVMEILATFTPIIEVVSVDEAYLDLTGSLRRLGKVEEIAHQIQQRIWLETHLTCSVGIGISKSVAKIASGYRKPQAITIVKPADTTDFLAPLPLKAINGIGPVALKKLDKFGVKTVGQLRQLPSSALHSIFGSSAQTFLNLSAGIDLRRVGDRSRDKSIGKERTFEHDISNQFEMRKIVLNLADEVSHKLRVKGFKAQAVSLKIKLKDFQVITRSSSFTHPTFSSTEIRNRAQILFNKVSSHVGAVRLIGFRAEQLVPISQLNSQGVLDPTASEWEEVDKVVDLAAGKFGTGSLKRATSLEK